MNHQPQLEELEERSLLSADLAPFQQPMFAPFQSQLFALIPVIQSSLQANLNNAEALAATLPVQFQPLLSGVFAQDQQFVNAFPTLAAISFEQVLLNYEANLLAASNSFAFSGAGFGPGFFPFFYPGFFGYPGFFPFGFGGLGFGGLGLGGLGGLGGFGGGAFSSGFSGFSGGFSGFSGGSFGSAGAFVAGRGPGGGIMSTAGALTLPPSNNSSSGGHIL